jgi:glyoxylase-like metal-dependent hydrolase (beta-lactamase superfamily II)/rhodanese-related sulfurtransferase
MSEGNGSITPGQLKRRLDSGQSVFILDVRNEDEFDQWRIEGENLQIINIPYFELLEDPDRSIGRVPRDRLITVVCAKGGSSDYVADLLRQQGFQAENLAGGMIAWGNAHQAVEVSIAESDQPGVVFYQINRFGKGCLSYLIGSGGEAIIVDPSRHVDVYIGLAEKHGLRIKHVFDTHLHADHISGGKQLAELTKAKYHLSASDASGATFPYEPLRDGQQFNVGGVTVRVLTIETPGHTPGSTTLVIQNRFLLTGDTLFVNGTGRPDLGGMAEPWARNLYHTLFGKLAQFQDDIWVLPAHYSSQDEGREGGLIAAQLGELRKNNAAMRSRDEEEFVKFILAHLSDQPAIYQEIRRANLGLIQVDEDRLIEMELGKNQCAANIARASH